MSGWSSSTYTCILPSQWLAAPGGGAKVGDLVGTGFGGGVTGPEGLVLGWVDGPDGGMVGPVGPGGGRWTAQALRPSTRLSKVMRANAVIGVSSSYLSGLSMVSCCKAVVVLARGWLRPIHSPVVG